jgi:hypothetical protein
MIPTLPRYLSGNRYVNKNSVRLLSDANYKAKLYDKCILFRKAFYFIRHHCIRS